MLNHVTIMGNLGNDPELKTTPNGVEVATVTLAVSRDFKGSDGNRETDWIPVVAWRGTAAFLANNFKKGQQAIVCGRLQTRKYTTQDGQKRTVFEVIADNVYFCGKKENPVTGQNNDVSNDFLDVEVGLDELPF